MLSARADEPIYLARPDDNATISVAADHAQHWQQGSYEVWHLTGHCHVAQGTTDIRGPEGGPLDWKNMSRTQQQPNQPLKIIAYFEGTKSDAVTLAATSPVPTAKAGSVAGR